MTVSEFEILDEAMSMDDIKHRDDIATLAWLTVQAGATKKDGKPFYENYDKFMGSEITTAKMELLSSYYDPEEIDILTNSKSANKNAEKEQEKEIIRSRFKKLQELKKQRKAQNKEKE